MYRLNLPDDPIPDRVSIPGEVFLPPFTRRTYANLEGPGCIRHLWIVVSRHEATNRKCVMRIYFDGSEVPHVECPIGDFFGVMHGQKWYPVNTPHLSVKAETGYNCYFPMPFATSARVELETGEEGLPVYFMLDWHRYPGQVMAETRRFCARWRRENPAERHGRDFLVCDIDGAGEFLGFFYGVRLLDDMDRWSHGGADNFYGDGETNRPFYLRGIGGEDTFGTSYGGAMHPPETHLQSGMPFYQHFDVGGAKVSQTLVGYRFFDEDAIPFKRSLHFRFGCMANDICATTYWYQYQPPRQFTTVPPFPELLPGSNLQRAAYDLPLPDAGSWWLCGAFAPAEGDAFPELLPPEAGAIDSTATFDGGHRKGSNYLGERSVGLGRNIARWKEATASHGFVDFNHYFRSGVYGVTAVEPAIAIARAVLSSPRPCKATITLSWDDRALVRLNGEHFYDLGDHGSFRTREFEIDLREGENDVAIKLSNTPGSNHGGWAFAFRCVTDAGEVLLPAAAP
jgi:hypothetical protein